MARSTASAEDLLGDLEYATMGILWEEAPLTVGAVRERLNAARPPEDQLAYTTVLTVLSRLHDKGLLERERRGRGHAYRPGLTEGGLVERHNHDAVRGLVDRYGDVALSQFAAALRDTDPALLARLVEAADGGPTDA